MLLVTVTRRLLKRSKDDGRLRNTFPHRFRQIYKHFEPKANDSFALYGFSANLLAGSLASGRRKKGEKSLGTSVHASSVRSRGRSRGREAKDKFIFGVTSPRLIARRSSNENGCFYSFRCGNSPATGTSLRGRGPLASTRKPK